MFDHASTEPLDVIRTNEAAGEAFSLTTKRFRRLFNEIERLTAENERLATERDHWRAFSACDDKSVEDHAAEIARLRAKLESIATMPDEDNEWDGRDRFREVRDIAREGVAYQQSTAPEKK